MSDLSKHSLYSAAVSLSKEMALPTNLLSNLLKDDDWSFIIKSHALIESLLGHVISASLDDIRIRDSVKRLFLRDKIKFACALDLLHADGKQFIEALSEIRNYLAHNIDSVNFSVSEYIDSAENSKREKLERNLTYFAAPEDFKNHPDIIADIFRKDPKEAIWFSIIHFMAVLWGKAAVSKERHTLSVLSSRFNDATAENS